MKSKVLNIVLSIAAKLVLFISGAAFLFTALSYSETGRSLHPAETVILFFVLLFLPLKLKRPNRNLFLFSCAAAAAMSEALCVGFYFAGKEANTFDAAAQSLGVDSKLLLLALSAGPAVMAAPFMAFVTYRASSAILKREAKLSTKQRQIVFVIIAVTLASSLPLFVYGMDYGHDGTFHLARIESIARGIAGGQFPVRMNGFVHNDYGYPLSIFYGDLLLYIPALFRLLGTTMDFAYKAYVLLINLATAVISYLCFSKMFSRNTAVLAMAAYTMASYRLVDIYVRSAVGEYTAMLFLPLIALALWYIYTNETGDKRMYNRAVVILAVGMAGVMYSHLISAEMAVVAAVIVALAEYKKTFTCERMLAIIKAVGLTMALGAEWWLPFIQYYLFAGVGVGADTLSSKMLSGNVGYVSDYFTFFRSVRGEATINSGTRMMLTPGPVLMGALVLAVYLLAVKKHKNSAVKKTAVLSIIFLLMATDVFPWDIWSESNIIGQLMAQIQYPWRYITIACIALAVLLGCLTDSVPCAQNRKSIITKAALLCSFVMCLFFVSDFQSGAVQIRVVEPQSVSDGMYLPYGAQMYDLPKEVIVENGIGEIVKENGVNKDVHVAASGAGSVTFPAFRYPNYVVTDEAGRKYEISEGENRTIKIELDSAYDGMLYLRYKEPLYWRAAEIVSLCGCVYAAYSLRNKRKNFDTEQK